MQEQIDIEVKPGDNEETVHTFPDRGNEAYAHKQAILRVHLRL